MAQNVFRNVFRSSVSIFLSQSVAQSTQNKKGKNNHTESLITWDHEKKASLSITTRGINW